MDDSTAQAYSPRASGITMYPAQAHSDERFRFCDLSPESRNMVYRDLLVKETDITVTPLNGYLYRVGGDNWYQSLEPSNNGELRLQPAILLANRDIYAEALPILYRESCFEVDVGSGWIVDFEWVSFMGVGHNGLQTHVHFPLVRKLHARIYVSAVGWFDVKNRTERLRAGIETFIRILVNRKPLDVLKVSFLYGEASKLGPELYERVFEPLSLLKSLGRLEVVSELFEALPNTLSSLRANGIDDDEETNLDSDFDEDEEAVSDGNASDGAEICFDSDFDNEEERVSDRSANNDDEEVDSKR